jgi:hypothetical protein
VIGVIVLDAIAMGIYYLAGIPHAARRTQMIFVVTWSIATALTVAYLLRRLRAVRFAGGRR